MTETEFLNNHLLEAARQGATEALLNALAQGVDVNAKDADGETPLIRASVFGRTETAQVLLDHGAELEAKTVYGYTALMVASLYDRYDIVIALLKAGADIHAENEGVTALLMAKRKGFGEVVALLEKQQLLTAISSELDDHPAEHLNF